MCFGSHSHLGSNSDDKLIGILINFNITFFANCGWSILFYSVFFFVKRYFEIKGLNENEFEYMRSHNYRISFKDYHRWQMNMNVNLVNVNVNVNTSSNSNNSNNNATLILHNQNNNNNNDNDNNLKKVLLCSSSDSASNIVQKQEQISPATNEGQAPNNELIAKKQNRT
jgi:hypothetical protein